MRPNGDRPATHREDQSGLRDAVERERAAAARLAAELERARDAARRLDVDGMGVQLAQARRAADDLARAGGQRMRSAESLARNLAVAPDTSLDHLCLLAGPNGGLAEATRALRESLQAVSRASSALGICTRYGGAVAQHLAAFASGGACYGPAGRVHAGSRATGRRA